MPDSFIHHHYWRSEPPELKDIPVGMWAELPNGAIWWRIRTTSARLNLPFTVTEQTLKGVTDQ